MPTQSALVTGVFLLTVLAVAVVVLLAGRRAGLSPVTLGIILLVYLGIPALLSQIGALDRYDPLPPPALLLLLGLSILTVVTILSPLGSRLTALPLGGIIALQAFRIPVEWTLHRLYLEGSVPVQMTYSGRNFDIVSGVTGLLLGWWILSGRRMGSGVLLTGSSAVAGWAAAWNVLGLALLANIVGVAALSTPVPFRSFVEGPPNLLPSEFPWVWLPSFLVQVAFGSHLLVFRKLAGRISAPGQAP